MASSPFRPSTADQRRTTRALLLVPAFLLLSISVALFATGGFAASVLGLRVSAHAPTPSALAGVAFALLWLVRASRAGSVTSDLAAVHAWIEPHARAVILTVAALAGAVAVWFGTFSASGSDPSGYFSEAVMLSSGALSRAEPLTAIADWPNGAATVAPLGWRDVAGGLQVPTYAVGLPLLMAIPHALGGTLAAALVVSGSASLAVWLTGRIAMALGGGAAGIVAAVWLATMPIEIYESIQPMSDVPVTAAWLACWWMVAVSAIFAGLWAGLAVLIRPNLAPLAALPALCLLVRSSGTLRAQALAGALGFAVPVAIAGALIAYLQWRWFGSPLRSGYGTAQEIYSLSNLAPNAALYLRWLLDTHGPWLLAAPIGFFFPARPVLRWMLAFAVLVCLAYFVYSVFEDWPYLRFLLPAMAIAVIAVSVVLVALIGKLLPGARVPVLAIAVLAVAGSQIAAAREQSVFRLASRQARAMLAGRYLASALPQHAVMLSGEQSGAMRYYANRPILRWDFLDAASLHRAQARLAENGHDLWIVLDDWEVEKVRERFPSIGLDWPPAVEAGREGRTIAWRARDRAPFVTGQRIITDYLR